MHKDLPYNIASYSGVCMLLQWLLHTQSTYIGEHERLATQHSYSYSCVCMLLQWLLHTQSTYTESMRDLPHNIASYSSVCMLL